MNPSAQQVTERRMDQAVTSEARLTGEGVGDDQQAIVPAAALGAGVAGVPGGIVDQLQADRCEHRQALLNDRRDGGRAAGGGRRVHAGSTFLNGLTLTLA